MDHINRKIYGQLLDNERFIQWASGKNDADRAYWEQWQKTHPELSESFSEACRTVQLFRFRTSEVSSKEVAGRWLLAKKKMKRGKRPVFTLDALGWYQRLAGILIFPLLLLSLWLFYGQQRMKAEFGQLDRYTKEKAIRVVAPHGGQIQVNLPDGSKAWLNAGSAISYPPFFASGTRQVEMSGEVYFEVSKGKGTFVVKTPGPTIKVHGTEFNVHAYADENEITIALAEGEITLEQSGKETALAPGEVAVFDKSRKQLMKYQSEISLYTSWREGKYIFRNASLEVILKTLERNYNVVIDPEDPSILQHRYDATITGEPLEQILELLTFSAPLTYEYKKQQMQPDGSYSKARVKLKKDSAKMFNLK